MVLSSFYTYLKLFLAGLDLKTFKSSFSLNNNMQLIFNYQLFERTRRRKIAKQFSDGAGVSL
jgi:hypothetical protein